MAEKAYTIGRADLYDPLFSDGKDHWKFGMIDRETGQLRMHKEKPYDGGWVFRSAQSAEAFRVSARWLASFGDREQYAVYEMELPSTWSEDVSSEPDRTDGVFRLIHDARLLGRATL